MLGIGYKIKECLAVLQVCLSIGVIDELYDNAQTNKDGVLMNILTNMGAKRIRQGCVSFTLHAELSICSLN